MSSAPRHPRTSSRADQAELAFAAGVAEQGWIWHPAGRDVGVDGRVELVTSGSVTSDEFTVQIKSNLALSSSGEARIAGLKLTTLAYWHRKFPPTLLVALDPDTRQFAFEWAHAAIGRGTVIDRLEAGQKTTSLALGGVFPLDDPAPWQEIERYARLYFLSMRRSLQRTNVRGTYYLLLLEVYDVIDLLVDWTCWIAYADPANVVDRFVEPSHPEHDDAASSFELLRIWPGDDARWRGAIAEPIWAIRALAELHRGFLNAGRVEGLSTPDGQLESEVQEVQEFLMSAHAKMVTEQQPLPSGRVRAMGVAPAIGYGVGYVLIVLRDWGRLLRNLLFEPTEDEMVQIRLPGGNAARLHVLASTAVRRAPAWATDAERPFGPAWDRDEGAG